MTESSIGKLWEFNADDDISMHSVEKYTTVKYYMDIFSTSMKKYWNQRVYIDLFSGPGLARLKDTQEIIDGSPALALSVRDPFTKYIFCEKEKNKALYLRKFVSEKYPEKKDIVEVINGDCNCDIDKIVKALPASVTSGILSFCFVDPFRASNLEFDTLRKLSGTNRRIDYLILIPTNMDLRRNVTNTDKSTFDKFFGYCEWLSEWERRGKPDFGMFAVEIFGKQMTKIGYLDCGLESSKPIVRKGKAVLYHLCFYSRHPKAMEFWEKTLKGSSDQMDLFR